MKTFFTLLVSISLCTVSFTTFAQNNSSMPADDTQYLNTENDARHPCITPEEYALIAQRIAENRELYHIEAPQRNANSVTLLDWPLQPAAALHDCSYYRISAYVDENTTGGVVGDFNCGMHTYDGHEGTDIATWPFNFYKMDNDLVEVHAAAAGTIIDKHDGEFDRNCSANNLTANYIVIQHADGSTALYWHMKKLSVTPKNIGETVAVGEYLGVVGSSGSSTGPHLHFEVWAGSDVSTRIDPYYGTCNLLNASSWWVDQKDYRETSVVRASVHTTDIDVQPCPATEILNESTVYQVPFQGPGLSPGYAKFYMFLRDEQTGLVADLKILNPNGSTYLAWTYTSTADNDNLMWGFSKLLPTTPGTYTFQITYNGVTCSSDFDITTASTGMASLNSGYPISVAPNPSLGEFTVQTNDATASKIEIYNLLGVKVFQSEIAGPKTELNPGLSGGVYFYSITNQNQIVGSGKLVVE